MTAAADSTTVNALAQAITEAFVPQPEPAPKWERLKPTPEQARTIAHNQALRLDAEALAVQKRVDNAYLLAGKGRAPDPTIGQDGSAYARQAIATLKAVAGLSALDTTPMSDGVVRHLLDSVVQRVDETWRHPHDLPAGQCRTVSIPDRSGRETLTLVVGHGTPSPFRALYGSFLAPPQQAVAIGGKPVALNG